MKRAIKNDAYTKNILFRNITNEAFQFIKNENTSYVIMEKLKFLNKNDHF